MLSQLLGFVDWTLGSAQKGVGSGSPDGPGQQFQWQGPWPLKLDPMANPCHMRVSLTHSRIQGDSRRPGASLGVFGFFKAMNTFRPGIIADAWPQSVSPSMAGRVGGGGWEVGSTPPARTLAVNLAAAVRALPQQDACRHAAPRGRESRFFKADIFSPKINQLPM